MDPAEQHYDEKQLIVNHQTTEVQTSIDHDQPLENYVKDKKQTEVKQGPPTAMKIIIIGDQTESGAPESPFEVPLQAN